MVFITTETYSRSMGFLEDMAAMLNGEHYYLEDLL
jgi:Mg-chelatase subunit ChlD